MHRTWVRTNNPHPLQLLLLLLLSVQFTLVHLLQVNEIDAVNGREAQEFVVQVNSSEPSRHWRDISNPWLLLERSITNNSCEAGYELSKRQGTCSPGSPCGARCCNPGHPCCAGVGCCDPGEKCVRTTSGRPGCCPQSDIECSIGGCCSSSQKCCSRGCAPRSATCCNGYYCLNGRSCCGSNNCYDPDTQLCCPSGLYCLRGQTCCGRSCCLAGSFCRDGSCFRQVTGTFTYPTSSVVPPSSTPTSPSTTPTPSIPSAPSTPPTLPSITPTPSPPTTIPTPTVKPKATFIFDYQPNKQVRTNTGKRIPLSNKAVLINMCEGIKAALGVAAQAIQLTKDIAGRDDRRDEMCPEGYCANALRDFFEQYPELDPADFPEASIMECDEFPFANSEQGGDPTKGVRRCIPRWQNSWQGGKLSRKLSKLTDGDDYLVMIEGWDCEMQAPTKRDLAAVENVNVKRADVLASDDLTQDDVYLGFEDSDNALILSLGTLEPGQYTYSLQLKSGTLSTTFVTDYLGTQFYISPSSITSNSRTANISFQLSARAYGVGLVAIQAPDSGNISLTYSAAQETPSVTPSNAGMNLGFDLGVIIWLLLLALAALS